MTDRQNDDHAQQEQPFDEYVGGGADVLSYDDLNQHLIQQLEVAALSRDRDLGLRFLQLAQSAGVSNDTIADVYIPAVARLLGDKWLSDILGFVEVTIGTARLQSLLRELGPEWCADSCAAPDAPTILMVNGKGNTHTLGAVMATGQLRRRGYSVRLVLDAGPAEIQESCVRQRFDAVFVSANLGASLENLRQIVEFLRTTQPKGTPIIIGGCTLTDNNDVTRQTAADYATSNLDEALEFCGLTITPIRPMPQKKET